MITIMYVYLTYFSLLFGMVMTWLSPRWRHEDSGNLPKLVWDTCVVIIIHYIKYWLDEDSSTCWRFHIGYSVPLQKIQPEPTVDDRLASVGQQTDRIRSVFKHFLCQFFLTKPTEFGQYFFGAKMRKIIFASREFIF